MDASLSVSLSAVFLDRDGVINVNRPDHVKSWDEFQFLPGALDALARLAMARIPVFVMTNQAMIGRGIVSQGTVDEINRRMQAEIERHGGHLDAVLCCPHTPEEGCDCRKPQPGLLLSAARANDVDLRRCFVVGDALADIAAGQSVGCRTIMVLTGRGSSQHEMALRAGRNGYRLAGDLSGAVALVLESRRMAMRELVPCGVATRNSIAVRE